MDFGSQWNITRRGTLKEDHPEKTNQKARHGQFKRDHPERITYQQIPKAYAKHNKLTIQHAPPLRYIKHRPRCCKSKKITQKEANAKL